MLRPGLRLGMLGQLGRTGKLDKKEFAVKWHVHVSHWNYPGTHFDLSGLGLNPSPYSRTYDLSLPTIHHYLPHTVHSPASFVPAFKLSKNRSQVKVVLGIPTVKRDHQVNFFSLEQFSISVDLTQLENFPKIKQHIFFWV